MIHELVREHDFCVIRVRLIFPVNGDEDNNSHDPRLPNNIIQLRPLLLLYEAPMFCNYVRFYLNRDGYKNIDKCETVI